MEGFRRDSIALDMDIAPWDGQVRSSSNFVVIEKGVVSWGSRRIIELGVGLFLISRSIWFRLLLATFQSPCVEIKTSLRSSRTLT